MRTIPMTININVKELAGSNCISLSDGQTIYDKIHPKLKAGAVVNLNFEGVRVFSSPFFNAAIGQLLRDISGSALNDLLKVSGLPANGVETLKKVIENSRAYYSSGENRKAVEEALKQEDAE
jgi:STAS-like domain of unknown function (DUF4325)